MVYSIYISLHAKENNMRCHCLIKIAEVEDREIWINATILLLHIFELQHASTVPKMYTCQKVRVINSSTKLYVYRFRIANLVQIVVYSYSTVLAFTGTIDWGNRHVHSTARSKCLVK